MSRAVWLCRREHRHRSVTQNALLCDTALCLCQLCAQQVWGGLALPRVTTRSQTRGSQPGVFICGPIACSGAVPCSGTAHPAPLPAGSYCGSSAPLSALPYLYGSTHPACSLTCGLCQHHTHHDVPQNGRPVSQQAPGAHPPPCAGCTPCPSRHTAPGAAPGTARPLASSRSEK